MFVMDNIRDNDITDRRADVRPALGHGFYRFDQFFQWTIFQQIKDIGAFTLAHYRDDFPERDDTHWLKHTLAFRTADGGHQLRYKPVTITKYQPEERKY